MDDADDDIKEEPLEDATENGSGSQPKPSKTKRKSDGGKGGSAKGGKRRKRAAKGWSVKSKKARVLGNMEAELVEELAAEKPERREETVRVTAAPRNMEVEDAEGAAVVLSKVFKATQIQLSEDRLSATSWKGYRSVLATRGVRDGSWYFEIQVLHLGATGHARLGWCTQHIDLQTPIGYQDNGFSFRCLDGTKVHKAQRQPYASCGYREGDVIGCYISLPGGNGLAPPSKPLVNWRGLPFFVEEEGVTVEQIPGSNISFFKNGICQGTAFENIPAGRYFPAASLFTLPNQNEGATVHFNFGPQFAFPPPDWGERAVPRPVCEAPVMPKPRFMDEPEPELEGDREGEVKEVEEDKGKNDQNEEAEGVVKETDTTRGQTDRNDHREEVMEEIEEAKGSIGPKADDGAVKGTAGGSVSNGGEVEEEEERSRDMEEKIYNGGPGHSVGGDENGERKPRDGSRKNNSAAVNRERAEGERAGEGGRDQEGEGKGDGDMEGEREREGRGEGERKGAGAGSRTDGESTSEEACGNDDGNDSPPGKPGASGSRQCVAM